MWTYDILSNSNYGGSLFTVEEISAVEKKISVRAATDKAKDMPSTLAASCCRT